MFKKKEIIVGEKHTQEILQLIDKMNDKKNDKPNTFLMDKYNFWSKMELLYPEIGFGHWEWKLFGSKLYFRQYSKKNNPW